MAERRPDKRAGDAAREPSGGLKSVRILRETLVIDLRPLEYGHPALVEATYSVHNDAGAHDLNLVFVAAAMRPGAGWYWDGRGWAQDPGRVGAEGGVWLDGRPVEARAEAGAAGLPSAWTSPAETPGLDAKQAALPYEAREEGTLSFRVALTPGAHELRVRYEARPGAYTDVVSEAVYWQLGYVLAPAREWADFGGLDAKVLLPEGWRAAASPEMRREGDTLVAHWDSIPADALAVTAQTHESTVQDPAAFWKALLVLGGLCVVLAALAGWKVGGWLGRRGRTSAWGLLVSPAAAALLYGLSYLSADVLTAPRAPRQAAFNQIGNYNLVVTFLLFLFLFTAHCVVAQLATFLARRRLAPRPR